MRLTRLGLYVAGLVFSLAAGEAWAQNTPVVPSNQIPPHTQQWFEYNDGSGPIKLEVTAYEPSKWNGHIIVLNHGASPNALSEKENKFTWKFFALNRILPGKGYRVFVLMRKGRGKSEGAFTEQKLESVCDLATQLWSVKEAEAQLDSFVDHLRSTYKVDRIIVAGHSRGGYLSAYYGMQHPEKVEAILNMNGAWASQCEPRTRQTYSTLRDSAGKQKSQFWVYAWHDKYVDDSKIKDLRDIAAGAGISFIVLDPPSGEEGHEYAYSHPDLWLDRFLGALGAKS